MWAELLSGVELRWEGWNTPGLLVLAALAVLAVGLYYNGPFAASAAPSPSRKRNALTQLSAPAAAPGEPTRTKPRESKRLLQAPPAPADRSNKRKSLRRGGNPVDVQVTDVRTAAAPRPGVVMDRSRGGVLLSVGQSVEVGTLLGVRAAHAPDGTDWIVVEVRHCRPRDDRWLLGCKFTQELPWGILLLFG